REFARRDLPVFACRHRASALATLHDDGSAGDLEALRGRKVVLVAAIARPDSFRRTVEDLGADVVEHRWFRDHHRYSEQDAAELRARASELGAEIVTTEKDAVKLGAFDLDASVVRIDLEWIGGEPPAEQVLVA
ncbi:MAG: tetraacyldisaccharide 4'-kinase, partial [Planctomycetes bacterium]|nr:tetraacyldisaccharide 4'-kinase [Planctomycetota bacterium]